MLTIVQAKTSIPIPDILDWSDDASNAIGSEYIIMEHVKGVPLHDKWPVMAGDQQIRCIEAIYRKAKEAVGMDFPGYGSLYFLDAPFDPASKLPLNQGICIGPHGGARYWDYDAREPRYYHNAKPNQGPCQCSLSTSVQLNPSSNVTLGSDLAAYCDGLIDTGISRIPFADPPQNRPRYHGSTGTHLSLLESGRAVLKRMSQDLRIRGVAIPVLFHPDLHKRNIFVSDEDPSIITGSIDWRSSSIEPAFWYTDEVPDFARPATQHTDKDQVDLNEPFAKAFDVCTRYLVPKISEPRLMDEALFRPFRYCHRIWKDGATALRHELIETSQIWGNIGFTDPCPFPTPSTEELAAHQREYEIFEVAHHLRYNLARLLNTASDGWIPLEDWETTESTHREAFKGALQAILANQDPDIIKDESALREIWPYNIPSEL